MYNSLKKNDILIIARSLSMLLLAAILGVSIVEKQMNSLTHWHKTIQVFSISRWYNGTYCVCLFGHLYSINGLHIIGSFVNTNDNINFIIGGNEFVIPVKLYFDFNSLFNLLKNAYQWLVQITFRLIDIMYDLASQVRPYINKMIQYWRMITDMLFRYL